MRPIHEVLEEGIECGISCPVALREDSLPVWTRRIQVEFEPEVVIQLCIS